MKKKKWLIGSLIIIVCISITVFAVYTINNNSANVTKISIASKVVDTAVWGIFGTKRLKQWHCNSCSSDF